MLNEADVVYFSTFPSAVWNYGQSLNKIVDYMLAGKPIIGSYSGFYSMINEAKCGYLVEANNSEALADIFSNSPDAFRRPPGNGNARTKMDHGKSPLRTTC